MSGRRAVIAALMMAALAVDMRADSPLTSTDLATAYAEIPAVTQARRTRMVSGEVLRFLLSQESNDRKAAVINALGWVTPDKIVYSTTGAFLAGLATQRGVAVGDITTRLLTASDLFVLGYLRAMETYADVLPLRPGAPGVWGTPPLELLTSASQALPADFAVHYVRALVDAQRAMGHSFCAAYRATETVLEQFPERARNLRPAAVANVQEYMSGYKQDCTAGAGAVAAPSADSLTLEHDHVYSLARLGETTVAGTHAGVLVWHPGNRRTPVAKQHGRRCSTVLTWQDVVWTGCQGAVVRWDGSAWKSYQPDPTPTDAPFALFAGAAGELLVRRGSNVWSYSGERDAFLPIDLNVGADPSAVLFRRNGELWRIDYLKAVVGPTRTFAIKSPQFAGVIPTDLAEDAGGRLWVADVGGGVFTLAASGDRFDHQPGIADRASAMAFDAGRGRTWVLHYRNGPVLVAPPDAPRPVNVRSLGYLTDMLVEEGPGHVWVAGWTGLARLREDQGRWVSLTFRAVQ